jgi:hypothetical protein
VEPIIIVQLFVGHITSGQVAFSIEDPERRGLGVAAAVAAKRAELAAHRVDADAWFETQRREADEALSAR